MQEINQCHDNCCCCGDVVWMQDPKTCSIFVTCNENKVEINAKTGKLSSLLKAVVLVGGCVFWSTSSAITKDYILCRCLPGN